MINFQKTDRLNQLRAIANAAQRCECRDIDPRTFAAFAAAGLVALVSWTAFELSTIIGLMLAAAAFMFVYVSYPYPHSWAETLDCLVTDYKPIDIDSYSIMHEASNGLDGIDLRAIWVWLGRESDALSKVETEYR
jgi:hypothetical protein